MNDREDRVTLVQLIKDVAELKAIAHEQHDKIDSLSDRLDGLDERQRKLLSMANKSKGAIFLLFLMINGAAWVIVKWDAIIGWFKGG